MAVSVRVPVWPGVQPARAMASCDASATTSFATLRSRVSEMTEQKTALGLGSPTSPVTPVARISALQLFSAEERAVEIACTRSRAFTCGVWLLLCC